MSNTYAEALTISNYVFTGLLTFEMVLKLFTLGVFEYVAASFNLFDGLVVILSIIEIILDVSNFVPVALTTSQECQHSLIVCAQGCMHLSTGMHASCAVQHRSHDNVYAVKAVMKAVI